MRPRARGQLASRARRRVLGALAVAIATAHTPGEPVRFTAPANPDDAVDRYGWRPLVGRRLNLVRPYPAPIDDDTSIYGEDRIDTGLGLLDAPGTGISTVDRPSIATVGGPAAPAAIPFVYERGDTVGPAVPGGGFGVNYLWILMSGEFEDDGDGLVWRSYFEHIPVGQSYLGFRVRIEGELHFGWIGLVRNPMGLPRPVIGAPASGEVMITWIFAWGYETEPDTPIVAGDAPCPADVAAPRGVLDEADVAQFLESFALASPLADLAPPHDAYDYSDVLAFFEGFEAGCP